MAVPHPVVRCEHCQARQVQRVKTESKRTGAVMRYYRCGKCCGRFSTVDYPRETIRFAGQTERRGKRELK